MAESLDPQRFNVDSLFTTPAGEDLPPDGPDSDRLDAALQSREESFRRTDDLNWLMEGTGKSLEPPPPEPDEGQGDIRAYWTDAAPAGMAGAVAQDVMGGAIEAPGQAVGGMRDAVQNTIDFGDVLESVAPLGGFAYPTEAPTDLQPGQPAPGQPGAKAWQQARGLAAGGYYPPEAWEKLIKSGQVTEPKLPGVRSPETVTGAGIRTISQFLTGMGGMGRVMGGVRGSTAVATGARSAAAGAGSDFLAFQGQTERLSNLIQDVPALANPINDFLAAKPDDTEVEGRLKNAVEGLGLGAATSVLFRGLKAYRSVRNVQRGANADKRVADVFRLAEEEKMLTEAGEMSLLGRASGKLVVKKAKAATAETETGVPTDVAARSLTTRGLTPLDAAGDTYVNFARINAPDDIKRIIKDASSAFKGSIDAERRGVRTNAQTLLSAGDVNAWNTLLTRRTGQPLNAEQSVAARELWGAAANKLGEVATIASTMPSPENLFQFRRMLTTFHAIQKEVIGARTETARALQSWRIPVGGNMERMRDMTMALEQAGGVNEALDLARRFAAAARQPDGKAAIMGNMADKTFGQKALGSVQEYWINALLSGPKTHLVNITSNAAVAGLAAIERGAAARLGRVFSDEAGVEIGEAMAQIAGVRGSIIDAFRNAGKAFMTGESGYGMNKIEAPRERYISSGTWNVRSNSWLGMGVDALGALVNVPGKMLQTEDEFFKTIGYRMETHALAERTVQREIREGRLAPRDAAARRADIIDNPPESIRMEAVAQAAYQTFTSEPGKFIRGVQRIVTQYPVVKFVLPFINTPVNILKYTFERTPLAPLSSKYRAAIAKGGPEADVVRARMGLGTMALMYAIDLGLHGATTGSGPSENFSETQNWRRQGNQPYSVKFGDKQIAYNRLDPLGYTLGIGADLAEWLVNKTPDDDTASDLQGAFAATVFSIAENVTSKSYMQGLATLMEALNEPDRFAKSYVERFASSFIPTVVADAARVIDPVQRQSTDIVTAMKRRLPGFSSDLPPRRDLWGRPIAYQSGLGTAYDAFSPLYGSTYKPEPIDKLMEKDGWFLGLGGSSFTIDGERIGLKDRPDIQSRFYELRGSVKPSAMDSDALLDKYGDRTLLETLNDVVTGKDERSPEFEELETPEDREDFVKDIERDYFKAAKTKLFSEFPDLEMMAARKKALRPQ